MSVAPINATSIPPWIPKEFIIDSGNTKCPSSTKLLTQFAIFNCIAIAVFLLFGSQRFKHIITCGIMAKHKTWSFWSAFLSLSLNIGACLLQAEAVRRSGYKVDFGQLVQMAALRPRVAWLIGNAAHWTHRLGFQNGALDNAAVEVLLCAISCVFVGRLVYTAISANSMNDAFARAFFNDPTMKKYYNLTVYPGVIMLVCVSVEVIFAILVFWRTAQTKGNAEAKDYNSMMWISRNFAPVTCACSWMVWTAFLKSAEGAYCQGNNAYIVGIWSSMPAIVNLGRMLVDSLRK